MVILIRSLAAIGLTLAAVAVFAAKPPGAAVASAHPAATEAGLEMLAAGGNAFDAAVAISAVLAVVEPQSSGLGGGGFWLLHRAEDGRDVMIDGRETAPAAATQDMYLDDGGNYVAERSRTGALAAGIPGTPAALVHIAAEYGKLGLAESLVPAIRLAREGFEIDSRLHKLLAWRADDLRRFSASAAAFLDEAGQPLAEDATLAQPALADTLERLAAEGRAGFYQGETAKALVEAIRAAGGIWTAKDLTGYRVVEREPIRLNYRGYEVISASPPSSGGVVLAEILNILAGYPLHELDGGTRKHLVAEAMRRAYRDRAAYLGDPAFTDMPLARLTSPDYAAGLRAGIRRDRATASDELAPIGIEKPAGRDTTHFSVIDADGNRVAATLSINFPFGSALVAKGTGVVLNNEMDDFAAKPGTPNAYGLIGTQANAVAPGKRPLSSMSPTFMVGENRIAVLGTPGGSRIISMVLLGLLAIADGADATAVAGLPRYHHQYQPDQILYEPGALRESEKAALWERGHTLTLADREYGNMQVVIWDLAHDRLDAASDPRGIGAARVRHSEKQD
jgi:gamma-glutamyltranspeptidase/glutathione hydrolase